MSLEPRTHAALRCLLAVLLLAVLAACAGPTSRSDVLRATLYGYSKDVRWEGLNAAHRYIDPALLGQQPVSAIEINRNAQFEVKGYEVVGEGVTPDGLLERDVRIAAVNRHDQRERVIVHRERWRWDAEAKRWWLVSPPPTAGDR